MKHVITLSVHTDDAGGHGAHTEATEAIRDAVDTIIQHNGVHVSITTGTLDDEEVSS